MALTVLYQSVRWLLFAPLAGKNKKAGDFPAFLLSRMR